MIEHISPVGTLALATTCALIVKKALVELLKLPFRVIYVLFSRLAELLGCDKVDKGSIQVPTFYAPRTTDPDFFWIRITTIIVATFFGGIHCAGWNFPFPSHAELIIWRVCSLIIVIYPWTFVPLLLGGFMGSYTIAAKVYTTVILCGTVIYILARLTLLVEALTALRHLPPGAYTEVEWTTLLLHM